MNDIVLVVDVNTAAMLREKCTIEYVAQQLRQAVIDEDCPWVEQVSVTVKLPPASA